MRLALLILEDERAVREALRRDLAPFASHIRLEEAEDVETARDVITEIDADGDQLALVLADHRLPGTSGVDFLISLRTDERASMARTILVTGQADQEDTIRAINEAQLDRYVAKPWQPELLCQMVRDQLTDYVVSRRLDPLPHLPALDAAAAMTLLQDRGDF